MKPKLVIDKNRTKKWYLNGVLHREDGHAVEYANGTKQWILNGLIHREDGPAIEYTDGSKEWYLNGKRHREDGPAVEYANGDKYWYINSYLIYPQQNLIETPETEDKMLAVFNQYKFVKFNGEFYFINQYIKKFKKEWYEKYRLLIK